METLNIREDGSEVLEYNAPGFPISTEYNCLSIFADYAAGCHWHRDFEALIALDAELDYQVNGQTVHMKKGDAIFVNSGRLHFGYSAEMKECNYCFAVFHPDLLGMIPAVTSVMNWFSGDSSPDYWLLSAENEEDRKVIDRIRFLCDHADPKEALAVVATCSELIDEIRSRDIGEAILPYDQDWLIIRKMVGYIQTNFQERICLEQIASAGAVCRSRCCQLFRDKLHTSPISYVTRYRLEKACDLIRNGASITDAAFSTGFQGVSYFSETFKKAYGIKPSQYGKS